MARKPVYFTVATTGNENTFFYFYGEDDETITAMTTPQAAYQLYPLTEWKWIFLDAQQLDTSGWEKPLMPPET